MIFGLVQTLVEGLNIDLRVWRKTSEEAVRRDYTGYSGSIDYLKPELVAGLTAVFGKVDEKLQTTSSAIITLLLLLMILFGITMFLLTKLRKVKTRTSAASSDVEETRGKLNTLGEQISQMFAAKKRAQLLDSVRRMVGGQGEGGPDPVAATQVLAGAGLEDVIVTPNIGRNHRNQHSVILHE